jgi:hypothetical protein
MYLYSGTDSEYNSIMPDENSNMELAQTLIEYVLNVLAQVVVAAPVPLVVPTSCIPHSSRDYNQQIVRFTVYKIDMTCRANGSDRQ